MERIDPAAGTRSVIEKQLRPVAGFDLVFSCPKSVSLLHALGDADTRRQINEAHTSAWQAALGYLEDEACITRRGRNGVEREHAGGFIAAAFQHRTSRALDPHLHTHVIVANMARSPSDGRYRALDGEAILKTYRLAAGYLYEAQLRHELTTRLGLSWQTPRKGYAELAGTSRELIDAFSRRRHAISDQLEAVDREGFYASQRAALETRERKEPVDLNELTNEWRVRAAEHGLTDQQLRELLAQPRHERSSADVAAIARELVSEHGLTEKQTAFSEPELVKAWANALTNGAPTERIRQLAREFTELDDVTQVVAKAAPGRPARYSTSELVQLEQRALTLAAHTPERRAPTAAQSVLEAFRSDQTTTPLSEEQRRMVERVARDPARVSCVVGLAGAGKTTATRALARTYKASGLLVIGAAPSGVAAETLEQEARVHATTLHRLLADAEREGLPRRAVVVVDEAGMAETRLLASLLDHINKVGGKLVLIGDPNQLPAVGAGGLFSALIDRHGATAILTENRRQRHRAERDALARVRDGVGRDYLAHAQHAGTLHVSETPHTAKTRLLADWWNHARTDPAGAVMIAHRRRDVHQLNQLARQLMHTHHKLGPDTLTINDRDFAVGDRVICVRNNPALQVTNGTRATITTIDPKVRSLVVRTDRGRELELPATYLEAGHIRHAYAITGHASQGITVEQAFVLGTGDARLKEWGYVALSRARQHTRLYVTATQLDTETHIADPDPRDALDKLAQALEQSQHEHLATDQQPLDNGLLHTIRAQITRHQPTPTEQHARRTRIQQQLATRALVREPAAIGR